MRVFLTGATGFLGSFALRRLLARGHEVAVLTRPGSDAWRIADCLPSATVIEGDLLNLPEIEPAIAAFAPESVAHLAWSGVGNRHRDDPAQVENIGPTLELVRIAHRVGARAWVGLGSQAEYGPHEGPLDERAPTRPTTLYGHSKLACSQLAGALCDRLGLRFAWLRLFSCYGPTDDPAWMIPYLIGRLMAGERPALTWGEQRWDYIFVADAAEAVCRSATSKAASGIYNLGSGEAPSLRSIVEQVRDLIDPGLHLGFGEVPYRADQVMHLQADISRLKSDLGWSPRVGLAEGLGRTVEWSREHRRAG
jgi:nucleoside-diphosphate-sugar epimerase